MGPKVDPYPCNSAADCAGYKNGALLTPGVFSVCQLDNGFNPQCFENLKS